MIKPSIILIGMMGSGKTSVGKILSNHFKFSFTDTDLEIENQENKTINQIFKVSGEPYFRLLEQNLLKNLNPYNCVISTGGGFPIFNDNMSLLLNLGTTFFLQTSLKEIHHRIGLKTKRPLYNDEFSLKKIYNERIPIYKKAHYTVTTDGKSISELANEIKLFIQ